MSKQLQVWGAVIVANSDWPTNVRQPRCIVAAPSRAAAARALGVTSRWLAEYGSTTGNDAEIAVALSAPGVPWCAVTDLHPPTFAEIPS